MHATDVIVVGSGAAGLTAALSAASCGARVTVIERSDKLGGTSAISGGGLWAANNRYMADLGLEDSREDAINYLRAYALGRSPGRLIERFVDEVNNAVDFLERETNIQYAPGYNADYQGGLPGARVGRSLSPGIYDTSRLGNYADNIRSG